MLQFPYMSMQVLLYRVWHVEIKIVPAHFLLGDQCIDHAYHDLTVALGPLLLDDDAVKRRFPREVPVHDGEIDLNHVSLFNIERSFF